jgi:hypothetical protein
MKRFTRRFAAAAAHHRALYGISGGLRPYRGRYGSPGSVFGYFYPAAAICQYRGFLI